MGNIERLQEVAQALTDEQVEALITFARSMKDKPFYDSAPPEALASIERGQAQIERGETVSMEDLAHRLAKAAKSTRK
ncbi:MAG: hypothetical protein WDN31_20340 [Hyphomicrobium sp.]